MKKYIVQRVKELFTPAKFQELDVYGVLSALQDQMVLKRWLYQVLDDIKQTNLKVDQGLFGNQLHSLTDLSARRKAIQDVLEMALSIHRDVRRAGEHNPLKKADFDLESVTVSVPGK